MNYDQIRNAIGSRYCIVLTDEQIDRVLAHNLRLQLEVRTFGIEDPLTRELFLSALAKWLGLPRWPQDPSEQGDAFFASLKEACAREGIRYGEWLKAPSTSEAI